MHGTDPGAGSGMVISVYETQAQLRGDRLSQGCLSNTKWAVEKKDGLGNGGHDLCGLDAWNVTQTGQWSEPLA